MRNVLYVLAGLVLFAGCSNSAVKGEMTLNGQIKGLKKGVLYLQKVGDSSLITTDSVQVDGNEHFTLSTPLQEPEMLYLYLRLNTGQPINERIAFFAEPGTLSLSSSLKNFGNEVVITGSENQQKLEAYKKLVKRFTDRNLELIREQLEAGQAGNDSVLRAKQEAQKRLLASKYLATVNFALNEKEYEVAPYLMVTQIFDANTKYLDTVYKVLPQSIKGSLYGKELAALIRARTQGQ
jgi:hypothetical protein